MSVAASRPAPKTSQPAAALARLPMAPLVVAGLTLAVFGLRMSQIDQSLFGDELWTFQQIQGHSLASMFRAIHPGAENAPPLFFVLAWISSQLGDPTVWIRLFSVVLGTAAIPVVYALGRRTVGAMAGVIGASIFALSPFSAFYATEARPYASVAFFVVLSTLALVEARRTGSVGCWVLYLLAAAAAAYTHYTAVFPLALQGAWSLWACRGRVRRALAANLAIALLYAPWLPHLKSKELGIIGFLEPLNLHNVCHDLVQAMVGYPLASIHAIPTITGLIAIAVCTTLGLLSFAISRRGFAHAISGNGAGGLPLITGLAVATPLGVLAYSLASTDIWDARDLYASIPYGAVLLATLLTAIPTKLRAPAVLVVLATQLVGTIRAVTPAYARPQFRGAAQYIDRVAGPRDPVIVYPSYLSLDDVITVHFRRRHLVIKGVPSRWPVTRPGGAIYLVYNDGLGAALRLARPRPEGYRLEARRHYGGPLPFTLLTYRRIPARRG